MEWFFLAIAGVIYIISAYITYHESWRDKWWFMPLAIVLGTTLTVMWYWIIRYIGDKDRIYFYSLCWDTQVTMIYYFMPIFFFGVKLDKTALVGLAFMIIGLVLLKVKV